MIEWSKTAAPGVYDDRDWDRDQKNSNPKLKSHAHARHSGCVS